MKCFIRKDGTSLKIVPGFRDRFRYFGRGVIPKKHWTEQDYDLAAESKIQKHSKAVLAYHNQGGQVDRARILEVGCGAGIDALLWAMEPVAEVVGIDVQLRLFLENEQGEKTRHLVERVLKMKGLNTDIESILNSLPVRFEVADIMKKHFESNYFDFLYTRSALEHFIPIEAALNEMIRIVRPGGLMHHRIDPFYWYRGCHPRAVIDIPWTHARLSPEEFRKFVTEYEGEKMGQRRFSQLEELNRFTIADWRKIFDVAPSEIIGWEERVTDISEALLAEHPEIRSTTLNNVSDPDLLVNRILVWLRNYS